MARPRALLACPHAWGSVVQVGGHHIARALVAAGWDVAYVSNPISPLHLAGGLGPELRHRVSIYRRRGIRDADGHLWAYVPGALLTPRESPILRSRWVHRNWVGLSYPNVIRVLRAHGFASVDLLYFDSVIQSFWLDVLPHRASVLRVGDRMSGFGQFTEEMRRMQRELAASVDLVVYSARDLERDVDAMRPKKTLHLPNGVDAAHFSEGGGPFPDDLAAIPRPIAVYVGAMEDWFDFDAVSVAAAELPDVSFVLIGPDRLAMQRLRPQPNLHILGPRPYAQIPRYLHASDVGLIPFDVRGHAPLVNGVHPLKLYEYMACGLPVVAARWNELVTLDSPAVLYREPGQLASGIRAALSEGAADRAGRVEFATRADWNERVRTLLSALALAQQQVS